MKTVLVVDRSKELIELLALKFYQQYPRHNFICTSDGNTALGILQTRDVDLIISGTRILVGPSKHEFVNIAFVVNKDIPIVLHTNSLTNSYLHTTHFLKCSESFFKYVEEFLTGVKS